MADRVDQVEMVGRAEAVQRILGSPDPSMSATGSTRPADNRTVRQVPTTPEGSVDLKGIISQTYAKFIFDDTLNLVQVKLIDAATDQVVREIPPQALGDLMEAIRAYRQAAVPRAGPVTPGSPSGRQPAEEVN